MLLRVSDELRRFARVVAPDPPRVAERNDTDINGDPLSEDRPVAEPAPGDEGGELQSRGPGAPMKSQVAPDKQLPTAPPQQRAPRRTPSHHHEWNPQNQRRKMREYMKNYRGTGKINHPKPQTGA